MDNTEFLYGKQFATDMKQFDVEIAALNEKHSDLLKDDDSLDNYFIVSWSQNDTRINISFTDDVLPKNIQNEVMKIFHRVFGDEK